MGKVKLALRLVRLTVAEIVPHSLVRGLRVCWRVLVAAHLRFAVHTDPAGPSIWYLFFADAGKAFALVGECETVVVHALGADLDFVDDEDLVESKGGDERPEDWDGGRDDGHVQFEDGEYVDGGGCP